MKIKITLLILFLGLKLFSQDSTTFLIVEKTIGNFQDAVSLSYSPLGMLYVVDAGSSSLVELEINSGKTKSISGKGWGELEFNNPVDVCATSMLDIFVCDLNNNRISQFDKSLNYISSITKKSSDEEFLTFQPLASAFSQEGFILILDKESKSVLKYEMKSGKMSEVVKFTAGKVGISNPKDITLIDVNNFAILDGDVVKIYDIYGNMVSNKIINEKNPNTIFSDGGLLYVTSTDKINVCAKNGNNLYSILKKNIIGINSIEIRDFAKSGESYFILTKNKIMVCSEK